LRQISGGGGESETIRWERIYPHVLEHEGGSSPVTQQLGNPKTVTVGAAERNGRMWVRDEQLRIKIAKLGGTRDIPREEYRNSQELNGQFAGLKLVKGISGMAGGKPWPKTNYAYYKTRGSSVSPAHPEF